MSVADDLTTVSSDLTTLKDEVDKAIADLSSTATSPAESVVSATVAALEAAGWTVTPPATVIPVVDAPLDTPAS